MILQWLAGHYDLEIMSYKQEWIHIPCSRKRVHGLTQWCRSLIPVEIGRIGVEGQPRQKVSKTASQQINWAWRYTSVIPATWEVEIRRTAV
jgi:hypothetical protein